MIRRWCRVVAAAALVTASGCMNFTNLDTPCGGTRSVDAPVVLPDTGLGAGGQGSVNFSESEPGRSPDETALGVWIFAPANTTFADNPPRVRVVTDNERVFLDLEATSGYQGSWYVRQAVPVGPLRDEIVAAFQAGAVTVEFSRTQPVAKVTRVRPTVRFAGTTPVARCV